MSKGRIFVSILIMALVALVAFAVLALREHKPSTAPEDEGSEQVRAPADATSSTAGARAA